MEKTMQDSQKAKDELWNRLWKEFGQLVYMEGMNDHVKEGANGDLVDFIVSEISKAKEPRLTQKEVSFINRLMVVDRYGEDETIKTKNNTLNSEEWEALLVKLESELDKLTTK